MFWNTCECECETALMATETPMVIITLLASLNSCVNPWIYLSFNDHVTVSWLCRGRRGGKAKARSLGTSSNTGTTRASRPASGTRPAGAGADTPLYRLSRPHARSTSSDNRPPPGRTTSVDL